MSRVPFPDGAKALLVDLDGTLIDSVGALRTVFFQILDRYAIAADEALFRACDGQTIPGIARLLARQGSVGKTPETITAEYCLAVDAAYAQVVPCEGADALLGEARAAGLALALVTSAIRPVVAPLLQRFSWSAKFDAIMCGDEVTQAKPAPDLYRLGLARLRHRPEEAVAIEDSAKGVAAARAAGCRTIGIAPSGEEASLYSAGAEFVCNSLNQLRSLLPVSAL
jgi:HAD superfamily hydrolase (TIGR01509 family)